MLCSTLICRPLVDAADELLLRFLSGEDEEACVAEEEGDADEEGDMSDAGSQVAIVSVASPL